MKTEGVPQMPKIESGPKRWGRFIVRKGEQSRFGAQADDYKYLGAVEKDRKPEDDMSNPDCRELYFAEDSPMFQRYMKLAAKTEKRISDQRSLEEAESYARKARRRGVQGEFNLGA